MPLSSQAPASAAPASVLAPRAVVASWAVTAATPARTSPTAPTDAPAATDPATGRPCAPMPRATTTATPRSATTATASAAARRAYRPVTPELTSSARPFSSSWRVWRTTANTDISAASTASVRWPRTIT